MKGKPLEQELLGVRAVSLAQRGPELETDPEFRDPADRVDGFDCLTAFGSEIA